MSSTSRRAATSRSAAAQPASRQRPTPRSAEQRLRPPQPLLPQPAARRSSGVSCRDAVWPTERGVDLATVAGTGRGGVVSKPDVDRADASRPAATGPGLPAASRSDVAPPPSAVVPARRLRAARRPPLPPAPAAADGARETREKMSTRRKRIAEHLLESQHATAHLTTFNEIDMSAVEALRAPRQGAHREGARRAAVVHAVLREGGLHGAEAVPGRERPDRRRSRSSITTT